MDKKRGTFFLVLLLTIFLTLAISAETCTIQTSCNPDNTVMKLSSNTNAHAELYDESNYNYYLCCDFTGTHSQSGSNKVLGLSSSTNAHAELPTLNNYANPVYFGDLECASAAGSCPEGYGIQMVSLSGNTNAHVAQFDDYNIKVCCRSGSLEQVYWASANDPRYAISYLEVVPGVTQVALVAKNVGSSGDTADFEVYEADAFFDDEIRTGTNALVGDINDAGTGIAHWTIEQEDLDKTSDLGEFYFLSNSYTSNELAIALSGGTCVGTNYCSDYSTESMCNADTCAVSTGSVNEINKTVTCGDGYICKCSWDNNTGTCGPDWTPVNKTTGGIGSDSDFLKVGVCDYIENTNDDCSDGFLTFLWDANIIWPSSNPGWGTQAECISAGGDADSCVMFDDSINSNFDNHWHYDPLFNGINSLLTQCLGGSNTIECPAQIQLAFFTLKNFIIAVILIGAVYVVYELQKKNKRRKKSKKKK